MKLTISCHQTCRITKTSPRLEFRLTRKQATAFVMRAIVKVAVVVRASPDLAVLILVAPRLRAINRLPPVGLCPLLLLLLLLLLRK
ncbi:hypothetical protein LZ30DRAFT_739100 [Colletotrichum cereale]|nr:hypothetical protein LZ30DRAFT_739100 [Colletotrichum cereale]